MVALNSLTTPFADALTTKGLQNRRASVYTASLVAGSVLFVFFGSVAGALGAAIAAVITQAVLSIGLVLANPSGRALLLAGTQRLLRPAICAAISAVGIWMLLPNILLAVPVCSATFFIVAAATNNEMRTAATKVAAMVQAKWRYAFSTP